MADELTPIARCTSSNAATSIGPLYPVPMLHPTRQFHGALLLLGALFACNPTDRVVIDVEYHANASAPDHLESIDVVVGPDRTSWPIIAREQQVRATLNPHGELPEITLLYHFDGQKHTVRGPTLERGHGYAVRFRVDEQGKAESTHCRLPCTL